MKLKKIILILVFMLAVSLALVACGSDVDNTDNTSKVVNKYTIFGIVLTQGDERIGGATISVGDKSVISADDGQYTIKDIEIEDSITISYKKTGYQDSSITVNKNDAVLGQITANATMKIIISSNTIVFGTVKDELDEPLSGVQVSIDGFDMITTQDDGKYLFGGQDYKISDFDSKKIVFSYLDKNIEQNIYQTDFSISADKNEANFNHVFASADVLPNKTLKQLFAVNATTYTQFTGNAENNNADNYIEKIWTSVASQGSITEFQGLFTTVSMNRKVGDKTSTNFDAYIYVKKEITNDTKVLKTLTRTFSSKETIKAVTIVEEDGTTKVIKFSNTSNFSTSIYYKDVKPQNEAGENWTIYNNNNSACVYHQYDLSEYIGKTVIVAIGVIGDFVFTDTSLRDLKLGFDSIEFTDKYNYNIQGIVSDNSGVLSNVIVTYSDYKTTTDSSGRYLINYIDIPSDEISISFEKTGYNKVTTTVKKQDANAGLIIYDIILTIIEVDNTTVKGKVIDEVGDIINGAQVSIDGFSTVITDANGEYKFGGAGKTISDFVNKQIIYTYNNISFEQTIMEEDFIKSGDDFIANLDLVLRTSVDVLPNKTLKQLFLGDSISLLNFSGKVSDKQNSNHIQKNWTSVVTKGDLIEYENETKGNYFTLVTKKRDVSEETFNEYDAYTYVKIDITENNKIFTTSTRCWSSKETIMAVSVISQDGKVDVIRYSGTSKDATSKHYGDVVTDNHIGENWTIYLNNDSLQYHHYDLSDYIGETVVISVGVIGNFVYTSGARDLKLSIDNLSFANIKGY